MAPQQSSNLFASISAIVIVLAAYNIELLIANIKLSFLIVLLTTLLFLLFKFLFKRKSAADGHSSIATTHTNIAKKPKSSSPAISDVQHENPNIKESITSDKPAQWSLQLLQDMDWKNFQELCAHYYESLGYITKTVPVGENKDVDLYLYKENSPNKIFGIIKCKKWRKLVGVDLVKALFTVQSDKKIPLALFFSTSGFSKTAISFCEKKHLKLISGAELLDQIRKLSLDIQQQLLTAAVRGDYTTPSCVKCHAKMALHSNKNQNKQVWRCQHYAKCKTTMYLSAAKK